MNPSEEEEENVCVNCNKQYEGEFVACDKCEEWHCAPCSKFTAKQLANIERETYICKACAKK
jgi:hypothetical protein